MNRIGQSIICGVDGTVLSSEEKDFLKNYDIGGVILFSHNFETVAQLAELINSIQSLKNDYPFFIAVDQEGGRVFRFRKYFTQVPAMLELARLGSPKLVFEVHQMMAKELKAVGVNLNFSPCCDVFLNPENKVIGDRAFGRSASEVEKFITSAIRGFKTEGLFCCAKHFPGHGNTILDSHFHLPIENSSLEEIMKNEIPPFIKAAKSKVEFMMMGHLKINSLDSENMTTLSSKAYQFLRQTTGFDRIIVSDDMEMKAIANFCPMEEAGLKTLQAGCDMLIYRSWKSAQKALPAILDAVENNKLDFSSSWKRISDCKKELLPYKAIDSSTLQNKIGNQEDQVLMAQVSQSLLDSLKSV